MSYLLLYSEFSPASRLSPAGFDGEACCDGEVHKYKKTRAASEVLIQQSEKNWTLNHASSLEMHPSLVKPSDENPAMADTLIAASCETKKQRTQLSCARIPHSQKTWDNKCVLF